MTTPVLPMLMRATSAVSLFAILAAAPAARAEGTSELEGLLNQSVVVTASQSADPSSDAPATVSTLTSDDMHRYGMRSLADAINFLSMGFITQDPLHSLELGGRGVLLTSDFNNHILVLVDGHVMNEQWDGTAYFDQALGIPFDLIDHVELVLGPGSVLYGGNAMLGVINVVTKSARNYHGLHLIAEGGASPAQRKGRIDSFAPSEAGLFYRVGAGGGAETTLAGRRLELVGQIELYKQDGPSFSWGPQVVTNPDGTPANYGPNSPLGTWGGVTHNQYNTTVPSAYMRLKYGEVTASVHAESYRRETPYVNNFNQFVSDFDDPSNFERDRWLRADVKLEHQASARLMLSARFYGDLYDFDLENHASNETNCFVATAGACQIYILGRSRWAGLELQARQDWFGNGRLTTLFGVDGRVRSVWQRLGSTDTTTGADLGPINTGSDVDAPVGVYLQQRWTPVRALHLNVGARFDRVSRGGEHLSPRAAVVFDAWQGATFKAVYSEAFRPPNFYEYNYAGGPNPLLKSETERSVEASFEQRIGPHRIMFGGFRSWWSDMVQLVFNPDTAGLGYENASAIDNMGVNGAVDGQQGAFHYGLSFTGAYTRRRAAGVSTRLTVAPQVFGNARVAYDLPRSLPTLGLAASVVGPRLADRALDGNFAVQPTAPTQVELRGTVSGDIHPIAGLSYRLSLNYALASTNPYVAGPIQNVDPTAPNNPPAELVPVNRMTVFLTLQYQLFR
jgi:outer membrane receptor for ferrienterochelin and colicins